jgi:hypothetical protein
MTLRSIKRKETCVVHSSFGGSAAAVEADTTPVITGAASSETDSERRRWDGVAGSCVIDELACSSETWRSGTGLVGVSG